MNFRNVHFKSYDYTFYRFITAQIGFHYNIRYGQRSILESNGLSHKKQKYLSVPAWILLVYKFWPYNRSNGGVGVQPIKPALCRWISCVVAWFNYFYAANGIGETGPWLLLCMPCSLAALPCHFEII